MVTNTNQNPTPPNWNAPNHKPDNSKKLLTAAGVIIALLLASVIGLLINRSSLTGNLDKTTTNLDEQTKLNQELEKQYNDANLQLETLRGTNADLNSKIDQMQADLATNKERIGKLIRENKDLGAAKSELAKVRGQVDQYITQIKDLQEQNRLLTDANSTLTTEKTQLSTDLQSERTQKQEVIAAKETLAGEKAKVDEQNVALGKKVDRGSVVAISDIQAQGFAVKDSGKEVSKKNAKNIERLRLSFNLSDNNVTANGRETFHIRIINPTGETISIASQGGGQFKASNGESVPYSTVKEVDYNNDAMNAVAIWDPGTTLKNGTYEVEIYNKGFIAGKGSFTLK